MSASTIISALKAAGSAEKALHLSRFFKTGPGQYGEGDCFLGVVVPENRRISKAYLDLPYDDLQEMLNSKWHEVRLSALIILVERFKRKRTSVEERDEIYHFYLKNACRCNNWDLVDLSCPTIVGRHLLENSDRSVLYQLAKSDNLWEQRISIVSTITFIRSGQFEDTINLAKLLMNHKHDLMHKAIGWMLREIGKKDRQILNEFLNEYAALLPRTSLRYAIEHHSAEERKYYMSL